MIEIKWLSVFPFPASPQLLFFSLRLRCPRADISFRGVGQSPFLACLVLPFFLPRHCPLFALLLSFIIPDVCGDRTFFDNAQVPPHPLGTSFETSRPPFKPRRHLPQTLLFRTLQRRRTAPSQCPPSSTEMLILKRHARDVVHSFSTPFHERCLRDSQPIGWLRCFFNHLPMRSGPLHQARAPCDFAPLAVEENSFAPSVPVCLEH